VPPGGYNTAEYANSNAAVAASATTAYDKGATGQGVKLAVVDSGINPGLAEFAGRIDPASRDVAGSRGISDEGGHGTSVTAVAAAARDGVFMHGVAFNSTILNFRADDPGSCVTDDGCEFRDPAIAAGVRAAADAGAKVINLSLGGSSPGSILLNAMSYAVGKGAVLVISAGNDGEDASKSANADPFAAVPAGRFPGSVIVAGSVGTFNGDSRTTVALDQLSPFSNRAGTSQNSYLAALGAGVKTVDQDGGRFFMSGTSFSAPTITGAVALLAQAFPNLTGKQMVEILFTSADDLGVPGTDTVFGRGRLNIARAFQPMGATTLAGSQVPVTSTTSTVPGAAGDASATGTGLGAVILDGYSRAFAVDLARSLRAAEQAAPLGRALAGNSRIAGASAGPVSIAMTVSERRDRRQGFALERTGIGPEDLRQSRLVAGSMVAKLSKKTAVALGFAEGAKAMSRRLAGVNGAGFLVAADALGEPGFIARHGNSMAVRHQLGPVGVTVASETGKAWESLHSRGLDSSYKLTGMTLDRSLGGTALSLGLSRLQEKRTVLGGWMTDMLGGGGASTSFLDLEARREFGGGVSAGLSARRGWTRFAGGDFRSGAYAFDLAKLGVLGSGDRLSFRLAQPLRIERGGLALMLPTGWSYATETPTLSLSRMSLAPRGHEVDAELGYSSGVLDGSGWLGVNLFARRQPGHFAQADADVGGAVRFTLGF
jgi:hypothetical protein